MNGTPLHSALRQLQAAYRDPVTLAAVTGVGLVAGLAGPFSTFEQLSLPVRLVYWIAIATGSYAAGLLGAYVALGLVLPRGGGLALRIGVLSVGASVPVTLWVVLVNLVVFPDFPETGLGLGTLYLYCLLISLALMAVIEGVVEPQMRKRGAIAPATERQEEAPPILERLPRPVRGRLSHMSMADHYVEVHTDKGKALVLMRLSDAIAETRGVEGLQIHRSHWVARAAVRALKRVEGRPVVELVSGETLPVSRSFLGAARARLGG